MFVNKAEEIKMEVAGGLRCSQGGEKFKDVIGNLSLGKK